MDEKLKLFVWEGVLCETFPGIMVALAPNVEVARALLHKKVDCFGKWAQRDLQRAPQVYEDPCAFYALGGD